MTPNSDTSSVLLAILDGWGHAPASDTNAITVARTPNLDRWRETYPFTTLTAHNGAVGLPEGQMGNSEVGHLNIGAGRIVYQDYTRINMAIEDGTFFDNPVLAGVMEGMRPGGALHLLGLVSDGGVHSHLDHLIALLEMARRRGVGTVFIHAFMDGRDTPPESGAGYLETLASALAKIGTGRIATICGRYYAMDRDNRWQRVEKAWRALVNGEGRPATEPVQAVREAYQAGETDEFIEPVVLHGRDNQGPVATVRDGDSVIFYNFRADRARQLTRAFTDDRFDKFERGRRPRLASCVTFTRYDRKFDLPVAFPPVNLERILGEEVSRHGLRQLRIAETEKYAHVTYFFNGGREAPFAGEERILIPSPQEVDTYDQKPEMSAYPVTERLLAELDRESYHLVVLNFANGDMVGHTGKLAAAVQACEAVDECLGRLVDRFTGLGGTVIITADHGNAETMYNPETGGPFTAHTSNPVPFILIDDRRRHVVLRRGGSLPDIAPTVLALMGLPVPGVMSGVSLLAGAETGEETPAPD